jgi:hypothetical protein
VPSKQVCKASLFTRSASFHDSLSFYQGPLSPRALMKTLMLLHNTIEIALSVRYSTRRRLIMERPLDSNKELKLQIVTEIGNLSRLLGQIPSDDKTVHEARDSFLKLCILIDQVLDLKLQ